jgi:hypothetical protein
VAGAGAGWHGGWPKDTDNDPLQARLDDAVRRVGQLSMENEILRKEREQRFNCRQVQYAVGIDRHTAFLARFLTCNSLPSTAPRP